MSNTIKKRKAIRSPEQLRNLYIDVSWLSYTRTPIAKQAEVLEMDTSDLYCLRYDARRYGFEIATVSEHTGGGPPSERLLELDNNGLGPACKRCFLHGAHKCTDGMIYVLATSQGGAGPFQPRAFDDKERKPRRPRGRPRLTDPRYARAA